MRRSFVYATALFATMLLASCADSAPPRAPALSSMQHLANVTLSEAIDIMVADFFPTGLETATGTRWRSIKDKLAAGDDATARKMLIELSKFITNKTRDIAPPAGETKAHAAARLVLAMSTYVYGGPTAPLPDPGVDAVYAVVPAGDDTVIVTPSVHAGISIPAGATNEDRIIAIVEDPATYPAVCQGPLPTSRCQYPLFYKFESFPHLRLNTPAHFAVCMVTTGDRAPLDYPDREDVHERMALAHNAPLDPADRTPGATYVDGIEILPHSAAQQGIISCNETAFVPDEGWRGVGQRAVHALASLAGRIFSPKEAYAYDSGPEHDGSFFSSFNGVDPYSAPDLAVTITDAPTEGSPLDMVQVTYAVANASRRAPPGAATASAAASTAKVYLSTDDVLDESDALVGSEPIAALAPDAPAVIHTATFQLPGAAGTVHVIVDVQQASGGIQECEPGPDPLCHFGNNRMSVAIRVTAPAPSGSVLFGVNASDDGLSVLDRATGAETFIGRLDADENKFTTPVAMAVDPQTDVIYAWTNTGPSGLVTVDRCTGQATLVNPAGTSGGGGALAISPITGTMYLLGNQLYTIDKTTGVSTGVAPLSITFFAADFDVSGVLYAVDGGGSKLYTVNTSTGAATEVADLNPAVGTMGSIAFAPDGTLIGTAFGTGNILFDIDKATGAVTNVRNITGGFPPQGLGFASGCAVIQ